MISWLHRLEERFLNLVFPRRCVTCSQEGSWLCSLCQAEALREAIPEVLPSDSLPAVVSLLDFEIPAVRKLIHLLKYGGIREAAQVLGSLAQESVQTEEVRGYFGSDIVLVPVSTSNAKRKSRGYNQAVLIAEMMGAWLGVNKEDGVLVSLKNRQTQVGKGVAGRMQVSEQFAIDEEKVVTIQHKPVVLVDDVYTTGGTIRACAELLKAHGIAVAGAIVMAHSRKGV